MRPLADTPLPVIGLTVREVARLLRVSPDKIRLFIKRGELSAIDTATTRCGRPRYVIMPQHLAEFIRKRAAGPPPKPARRRKRREIIDFYPD